MQEKEQKIDDKNASSVEIITELVSTIQAQAEEIGRLKERISQLEREKGKDVSDARTSGVANAG